MSAVDTAVAEVAERNAPAVGTTRVVVAPHSALALAPVARTFDGRSPLALAPDELLSLSAHVLRGSSDRGWSHSVLVQQAVRHLHPRHRVPAVE